MSSVLTLLAITIDRFLMISKPLTYPQYRTGSSISIMIGAVWGFAILSMGLVVASDNLKSFWIGILIPLQGIVPLLMIFVLWALIAKIALRAQSRLPGFRYSIAKRIAKSNTSDSLNLESVKQIDVQIKTLQKQKPTRKQSSNLYNADDASQISQTNRTIIFKNKIKNNIRSLSLSMAQENRGLKMAAIIIGYAWIHGV